jgi:hypothetical protein
MREDKGLDKLIKKFRDISNSYVNENIMEE